MGDDAVLKPVEDGIGEIADYTNEAILKPIDDAVIKPIEDGIGEIADYTNEEILNPTEDLLEELWNQPEQAFEDAGDAIVNAGDWIVAEADIAGDAIMGVDAAALEAIGIDTAAMSAEEIALLAVAVML